MAKETKALAVQNGDADGPQPLSAKIDVATMLALKAGELVRSRKQRLANDAMDFGLIRDIIENKVYAHFTRDDGKAFTVEDFCLQVVGKSYRTVRRWLDDMETVANQEYYALQSFGLNFNEIRRIGAAGGMANKKVARLIDAVRKGEEISKSDAQYVLEQAISECTKAQEERARVHGELEREKERSQQKSKKRDELEFENDKLKEKLTRAEEKIKQVQAEGVISGSEKRILEAIAGVQTDAMVYVFGKIKKIDLMHSDKTRAAAKGLFEFLEAAPITLKNDMAKAELGIKEE